MFKELVFISDFDGTISNKDFYLHIIDKYMKEEGNESYKKWQMGEIKDVDFLGHIFKNIGQEEQQIHKDIIEMQIDPYLKEFIEYIHSRNGDFVVLSAGADYYIKLLFEYLGIHNITIYSNKAIYKDKGIHFDIDPSYEYYSERYGIDKKKVVENLKTKYSRTIYAGDSMPDFEPSLICDKRFATGKLKGIFKEQEVDFYPFDSFKDIRRVLEANY